MDPLRELLFRASARYLQVHPSGLVLDGAPRDRVAARILHHTGARTLYRGRRPHCRSLDGVTALNGQACADCHDRKHCTPQVRLDLLIDGRPYRLLLAYTSATNLLAYRALLRAQQRDLPDVTTSITVIDRGRWGELRFAQHAE